MVANTHHSQCDIVDFTMREAQTLDLFRPSTEDVEAAVQRKILASACVPYTALKAVSALNSLGVTNSMLAAHTGIHRTAWSHVAAGRQRLPEKHLATVRDLLVTAIEAARVGMEAAAGDPRAKRNPVPETLLAIEFAEKALEELDREIATT